MQSLNANAASFVSTTVESAVQSIVRAPTELAAQPTVLSSTPISMMPATPLPVANAADDGELKSFSDCMKQGNQNFEAISKLKPKSKPIIDKVQGKRLACVTKKKAIDLFVSRLKPTTVSEDVYGSVLQIFENDDGAYFDAADVKCIKLDRKYNRYASFWVTVTEAANLFDHVKDVLSSADTWPDEALIRQFYTPTIKANE